MGKRIIAIDPGNEKSAFVIYKDGDIATFGILDNHRMLENIAYRSYPYYCERLAIEMVASYGMPVGKTVFETCLWIGRFIQKWGCDDACTKIYRKIDVCMHLCHSTRAKDSNIRQAILDKYPGTGGGKTPQVGTKSKPGPLYGIKADIWSALAIAITYEETAKE